MDEKAKNCFCKCTAPKKEDFNTSEISNDLTERVEGYNQGFYKCFNCGYPIYREEWSPGKKNIKDEEYIEIDGKKWSKSTIKEALKKYNQEDDPAIRYAKQTIKNLK